MRAEKKYNAKCQRGVQTLKEINRYPEPYWTVNLKKITFNVHIYSTHKFTFHIIKMFIFRVCYINKLSVTQGN